MNTEQDKSYELGYADGQSSALASFWSMLNDLLGIDTVDSIEEAEQALVAYIAKVKE